jgi:hypothetical protein
MAKEENKPEKKFRAGAVSATVWLNKGKDKDGKEVEFRTVSVSRTYKDKNDEWQNTSTMRVNDLPKLGVVTSKAYEYLVIKEDNALE